MNRIPSIVPVLVALLACLDTGCDPVPFRCKVDHDCNGTDLCKVSTGECVLLSTAECRRDEECVVPTEACWDLSCVARCSTEADCSDPTRTCADGRCVPRGADVDAAP